MQKCASWYIHVPTAGSSQSTPEAQDALAVDSCYTYFCSEEQTFEINSYDVGM